MWGKRFLLIFAALFVLVMAFASVDAQDLTAETLDQLRVRNAPGLNGDQIGSVPPNIQVILEGRNDMGDWVLIRTPDSSMRGWVSARYLKFATDGILISLPVTTGMAADVPPGQGTPQPTQPVVNGQSGDALLNQIFSELPTNMPVGDMLAQLESVPALSGVGRSYDVFVAGKSMGNRANVFSKVGDSITVTQPFMTGFGTGQYELGTYGGLQETINFFAVSPRDGVANSFVADSKAAFSAFSSAAVLDPIWANPSACLAGESPLVCEFRSNKPAVAVILLGPVDMQVIDLAQFSLSMRQVVETSINMGVIPVLTTFASNPAYNWEKSLQYNLVTVKVARDYNVPLINLWAAAQPLPNNGVGEDYFHLSHREGDFIALSGEQNQWGLTLRNFLTLQMLDKLRREVLTR